MNFLAPKEIEQMVKHLTANKYNVTTNVDVTLKDGVAQQTSIIEPDYIGEQAEYTLRTSGFTVELSNVKYTLNGKAIQTDDYKFTFDKSNSDKTYYIYGLRSGVLEVKETLSDLGILLAIVYIPKTATKIVKDYQDNEGFVIEAPVQPIYNELLDFIHKSSDLIIQDINKLDASLMVGDLTASRWLKIKNSNSSLEINNTGIYFYDKNGNEQGHYTSDEIKIGDSANYLKYLNGNLYISGTLSVSTGSIGGWNIGQTKLSSTNITLDSSISKITAGSIIIDGKNNKFNIADKLSYSGNSLTIKGNLHFSSGSTVLDYIDKQDSFQSLALPKGAIAYFTKGLVDNIDLITPVGYDRVDLLTTVKIDGINIVQGAITTTHISDNAITTPKLVQNQVTADKINVNDLFAQDISVVGQIHSYGKTAYTSSISGFWLGKDTDSKYKFNIGNAYDYLMWTGSSLLISGILTASTGSIGGWDISANTLASSGSNLLLDSSKSRFSVIKNSQTKIALGYLEGIVYTKEDGTTGTYTSSDYGLFIGKANGIHIESASTNTTVVNFTKGDWLVNKDQSIILGQTNDKPIIRLGTTETNYGLFINQIDGNTITNVAKFTNSNIFIGSTTYYFKWSSQGIDLKGKIISTSGSIGGWDISNNTLSSDNITLDSSNSKITAGSITIDGKNNKFNIGSQLSYSNSNLTIKGDIYFANGTTVSSYIDKQDSFQSLALPKGAIAYFTKGLVDNISGIVPEGYDKINLQDNVKIDGINIVQDAITTTHISDNAITTPKLVTNAVTADKINVNDLFAQDIGLTGNITVKSGITEIIKIGNDALGANTPGIAIKSSQGSTIVSTQFTQQIYNISVIDQIDSTHSLPVPIYIPSNTSGSGTSSGVMRIWLKVEKFRSYTKGAASGGGTTGINVNVSLSGNTDIAFGNDTSTISTSDNKDETTTVSKTTSSNGSHAHTVSIPAHYHSYTDYYEDTSGTGHVINKFSNTYSGFSEQSSTNGAHTHTISLPAAHHHTIIKGDLAHVHSLSDVNANATGSVNLPNHTHPNNPGIYENSTLSATITIKLNGTTLGTCDTNSSTLYIQSNINVSNNDVLTIESSDLARIVFYQFIQYNLQV